MIQTISRITDGPAYDDFGRPFYEITAKSMISGRTNTMIMNLHVEDLKTWQAGRVLIQNALPYLTADEREFLKTGITPKEWDEAFGSDEDE